MRTFTARYLALVFLGLSFGPLTLLADTPSRSTDKKSKHSSRSQPVLKNTYFADSTKNAKPNATLDQSMGARRVDESGFTNGVGSNPADHGINNSTATRAGDNGLSTAAGSSNDVKGASVPVPPVNSADMNSKAGKGTTAAQEKQGR